MTQTKSWGRKFEANQAALRVLYERQERLHDAAPELLDALKTARRVVLTVACGTTAAYIREALEVIDAALAKAEAQ
jgi:fructoselysine-6-P-deglycase FrlB-like protein